MVNITSRQFSFRAAALSSLNFEGFFSRNPMGPLENYSKIWERAYLSFVGIVKLVLAAPRCQIVKKKN
jgi:hypothetical protein